MKLQLPPLWTLRLSVSSEVDTVKTTCYWSAVQICVSKFTNVELDAINLHRFLSCERIHWSLWFHWNECFKMLVWSVTKKTVLWKRKRFVVIKGVIRGRGCEQLMLTADIHFHSAHPAEVQMGAKTLITSVYTRRGWSGNSYSRRHIYFTSWHIWKCNAEYL